MRISNAKPGGGSDLDGVLYEVMETAALPSYAGTATTGASESARAVRMGGQDAGTAIGASAFWQPDGLGGVDGAFPIAQQVAAGNATFNPSAEPGRTYRHRGMPIPIGYDPSQVPGGLAQLPFAYQAECEVLVRKVGTTGGINQFFFGFENPNASSMFLNAQGSLGFGALCVDGGTDFIAIYRRGDATAGNPGSNLPLSPTIPITTAPRLLKWRVTWGRSWIAEFFVDGSLVYSLDWATLAFSNLNQCNQTAQQYATPVIYAGANRVSMYYSRATVRLVLP